MSFNSDIILGALLVGSWAISVLYTVEIIQAAYYYRHFKRDNWMLKLLVSSAITIDSVSMVANCFAVYLYTVTPGPEPVNVFANGAVTALVQSFLATRYWVLTRNKPITLVLFLFITVAAGGAFASGAMLAIFSQYEDRGKAIIPGTIWLVTEAVADVSIAVALLLQYRKVKASFKETRSLLNRLAAQTIRTGVAGATIALAVLVTKQRRVSRPFTVYPGSHIPVSTGIGYCIGRVYCITLLANLNSRETGRMWPGHGMSNADPEGRCEHRNLELSEGGSIVVFRTEVVHTDALQGLSKASFKTNPGQGLPNDNPAVELEMTVNDAASYSPKKKDVLFAP
ncbi:hypothetical protein GGX14DRAFT_437385 [Mycena pura]|uniref:DUF6534 domain-containing protein n=1 Tax=Mycena pura TaxID=153505 RepID=A0AAD6YK77_9AGAR|nr:hypothetical protein GGX14DRAFT_437385 [Mycena pura]